MSLHTDQTDLVLLTPELIQAIKDAAEYDASRARIAHSYRQMRYLTPELPENPSSLFQHTAMNIYHTAWMSV
jgi:hypothetical protein